MEQDLFREFPPTPDADWEKQLARELRGADYGEKLNWHAPDGAADSPTVRPYYRRKDSPPVEIPGLSQNPGLVHRAVWETDDPDGLLHAALQAQNRDAAGMDIYLPVEAIARLQTYVSGATSLPLRWFATDFPESEKALPPGPCLLDLPGFYARSGGGLYGTISEAWDLLVKHVSKTTPGNPSLFLNATLFADSGADIPTELGATWSALFEVFTELDNRGIAPEKTAKALVLRVAAGPNFFFELAKFRALRNGWALLTQTINKTGSPLPQPEILATTTTWNLAVSDAHNNLLRLTVQAASAMLGGADVLSLPRYDQHTTPDTDFARRLSENLTLLLDREAHLLRVSDPAAGSWYIEQLTDELGEMAWTRFQKLEADGGFGNALKNGQIRRWIGESRDRKTEALKRAGSGWIGVTKFRPVGPAVALKKASPAATLFEPILIWDAEADLTVATTP